jgi:hypothetical protein
MACCGRALTSADGNIQAKKVRTKQNKGYVRTCLYKSNIETKRVRSAGEHQAQSASNIGSIKTKERTFCERVKHAASMASRSEYQMNWVSKLCAEKYRT